jgi:RimJ/RimL family protein N-acetyltransferase
VVDLLLSGATDDDLPLVKSWLTPEIIDLLETDDLIDQRKPFLVIMIHDNQDERAGFFNVFNIDFKNQKCEVGALAGIPSCHQVMKRAFLQLLDILFNGEGINRVYIKVLTRNTRLIRVVRKLGFTLEGIEQEAVFKKDHFEHVTILALLKNNFRKG